MHKSETDWYAKYAAALNTIHKLQAHNLQQAERIGELEANLSAILGYPFEIFQNQARLIDELHKQLAEVVEYAGELKECVDIAILHYAEVGSVHWNKFDTASTLPLPKAMQK